MSKEIIMKDTIINIIEEEEYLYTKATTIGTLLNICLEELQKLSQELPDFTDVVDRLHDPISEFNSFANRKKEEMDEFMQLPPIEPIVCYWEDNIPDPTEISTWLDQQGQ